METNVLKVKLWGIDGKLIDSIKADFVKV
jgi:hypothetical protein